GPPALADAVRQTRLASIPKAMFVAAIDVAASRSEPTRARMASTVSGSRWPGCRPCRRRRARRPERGAVGPERALVEIGVRSAAIGHEFLDGVERDETGAGVVN